jgi:hypothetical protein
LVTPPGSSYVNKLTTTKAEARIELLRELAAKYGPTAAGLLLA